MKTNPASDLSAKYIKTPRNHPSVLESLKKKSELLKIRCSGDVWIHLADYRDKPQEHVVVLLLDSRHMVLDTIVCAIGQVDRVQVSLADVFRPAIIRHGCASVIVSHNHPSSEHLPSDNDNELTERIKKAGDLLGIPLLDHVIVSASGHYSYAEKGLI